MSKLGKFAAAGVVVLCVFGASAVELVSPGSGDDAAAITAAIAAAAGEGGDGVVQLAPGTYTLTAQVTVDKPITVKGAGRLLTRIVSDGMTHRLFYLNNADAVLSDVTLAGAVSGENQGGAVNVEKGELRDAIVKDCRSNNYGGGVRVVAGAVRRCVVFNNVSGQGGGGIYTCLSGNGIVENTLAYQNTAQWGGGLYVESTSRATFVNCTFAENAASATGADVYNFCGTPANNAFVNTYRGIDAKKFIGTLTASPDSSVNPGFVSAGAANFRLASASDLLGQGVAVEQNRDVQGVAHPAVPSIGAYQTEDDIVVPVQVAALSGSAVEVQVNLPEGATDAELLVVAQSGAVTRYAVADSGIVSFMASEAGAYSLVLTAVKDGEPVIHERYNAVYAGLGSVYVDTHSANPVAPYDAPEKAARTIEDAITRVMDGGTVWICDGEHVLAMEFNLNRAVTIRGLHGSTSAVLKPTGANRLFAMSHADARLKDLTLRGSGTTCSQAGQAVCFSNGGTVEDCILENFSANTSGGAVAVPDGGFGRIDRSIIRNNMGGTYAGGLFVAGRGYVIVRNTLFYGNQAKSNWGSAVYADGPGVMVNCTLYDNPVSPVNYGEFCRDHADFAVTNCIFGSVSWYTGTSNRANNLGGSTSLADPGFRDRSAGDYRLGAGAITVIDQGSDSAVAEGDLDLAGKTRIQGEHVDLGAYEYVVDEFSAGFNVVGSAAHVGDSVSLVPMVAGGVNPVHSWRVVNLCDGETIVGKTTGTGEEAAFAVTFSAPGVYSFYDSVTDGDNAAAPSLLNAVTIKTDGVLYVAESGHPTAPYSTPETALTNLYWASLIAEGSATIRMLAGLHRVEETIELQSGVKIVGSGRDVTVVASQPDARHELFYLNNAEAVLSDFAITGSFSANYNGRSGACVALARGTVQDCLITNVTHMSAQVNGIAIYASSARARVRRVEIRRCVGGQYGVLYLASGAIADNCLVADSAVNGNFGATVYISGGAVSSNCTFSAEEVNAAYIDSSSCRFVNCLFDCPIRPTNSIDVTNVFHYCGSSPSLKNNNGGNFYSHRIPDPYAEANHCLSEVPVLFVDAASGDYHLTRRSPCRRAGVYEPWMRREVDLEGRRRTAGNTVDLGCYQDSVNGLTIFVR